MRSRSVAPKSSWYHIKIFESLRSMVDFPPTCGAVPVPGVGESTLMSEISDSQKTCEASSSSESNASGSSPE